MRRRAGEDLCDVLEMGVERDGRLKQETVTEKRRPIASLGKLLEWGRGWREGN